MRHIMIINMYAVYDKNVGAYMTPFTSLNDNSAIRNFSQASLNPEAFGKYPQDYNLYKLGTYNDSNGQFENLEHPIQLISAVNAIQVEQENQRYVHSLQMAEKAHEEDTFEKTWSKPNSQDSEVTADQ